MSNQTELDFFNWQYQKALGTSREEQQNRVLKELIEGIRDGSLTVEDVMSFTNISREQLEYMMEGEEANG